MNKYQLTWKTEANSVWSMVLMGKRDRFDGQEKPKIYTLVAIKQLASCDWYFHVLQCDKNVIIALFKHSYPGSSTAFVQGPALYQTHIMRGQIKKNKSKIHLVSIFQFNKHFISLTFLFCKHWSFKSLKLIESCFNMWSTVQIEVQKRYKKFPPHFSEFDNA